jgi:Spy/CpxP family protein refolding chaperone
LSGDERLEASVYQTKALLTVGGAILSGSAVASVEWQQQGAVFAGAAAGTIITLFSLMALADKKKEEAKRKNDEAYDSRWLKRQEEWEDERRRLKDDWDRERATLKDAFDSADDDRRHLRLDLKAIREDVEKANADRSELRAEISGFIRQIAEMKEATERSKCPFSGGGDARCAGERRPMAIEPDEVFLPPG